VSDKPDKPTEEGKKTFREEFAEASFNALGAMVNYVTLLRVLHFAEKNGGIIPAIPDYEDTMEVAVLLANSSENARTGSPLGPKDIAQIAKDAVAVSFTKAGQKESVQ